MIHDLTKQLRNKRIHWEDKATKLGEHFEPWILGFRSGLYIQYFENKNDADVHDKNRKFRVGGAGALVIHTQGASLKPGRFQGGFLGRRRQDADHLHRTRRDPFGATYRDCLKLCLLLDLTKEVEQLGRARPPSDFMKEAEMVLKRRLDAWIKQRDLLRPDATRHGDWRRLSRPLARLGIDDLEAILTETGKDLGVRHKA